MPERVLIKRVYHPPADGDGYRVLVDRLWPRGLSKEQARLDLWLKEIAPSHELRKWFHQDRGRWPAFKQRYLSQITGTSAWQELQSLAIKQARVTLLYASRDVNHNHAVILRELLLQND